LSAQHCANKQKAPNGAWASLKRSNYSLQIFLPTLVILACTLEVQIKRRKKHFFDVHDFCLIMGLGSS